MSFPRTSAKWRSKWAVSVSGELLLWEDGADDDEDGAVRSGVVVLMVVLVVVEGGADCL